MNRSRENLPVTISADWHSPIISATIYLRVAGRGSIIADVITLMSGNNPYRPPNSNPTNTVASKRRPVQRARAFFRWIAAIVGLWVLWTTIMNGVRALDSLYFWELSSGLIGGVTCSFYLLWIAFWGTLWPARKSLDDITVDQQE